MKSKIHIRNIYELFPESGKTNEMRKKVNCLNINDSDVIIQFSSPVYINAFVAILVLSGKGSACVNYKTYPVSAGHLLLLSSSLLFNFVACTPDFQCLCLLVSKVFMDEMDSTDMIYRRVKYGVRLYNSPLVELTPDNTVLLADRIQAIDRTIDQRSHLYYKEKILNSIFAFYLDLSDIIDRYTVIPGESNLNRYESIIKNFIELLVTHYREEHKVDFYSSRLNLSAHYLTLLVKRVTGQSVCDFIFEMLYSDARTLLVHSRLSVQEIAAFLNFSDQSAFGKFFKRKSGFSPADYRKQG